MGQLECWLGLEHLVLEDLVEGWGSSWVSWSAGWGWSIWSWRIWWRVGVLHGSVGVLVGVGASGLGGFGGGLGFFMGQLECWLGLEHLVLEDLVEGWGSSWVSWCAGWGWSIWSWRIWWRVGVLPSIAFTALICFAGAVNSKLLHLFVLRPLSDTLLPLLYSLEITLPLLIGVLLPPFLGGIGR